MRTVIKNEEMFFHFPAPVTMEVQADSLVVPDGLSVRQIILDFRGVRAISSLAIGAVLRLLEAEQSRRAVRICNIGPELQDIFERTGLSHILRNVD